MYIVPWKTSYQSEHSESFFIDLMYFQSHYDSFADVFQEFTFLRL